jgi:protein SCO1/2
VGARQLALLAGAAAISATAGASAPAGTGEATRTSSQQHAAAAPFARESIYQFDGKFLDDAGRPFSLGELRGRPVVVDLFFTSCGYACPLTVTDMLAVQRRLPAGLRDRTAFVLVSFDAVRDTPATLARYRAKRALDDRWILLHGDEGDVRELAALLGVQYRENADHSFSHSNLLTILNPEGEIVHRRTGLQGGLGEAIRAIVRCAK